MKDPKSARVLFGVVLLASMLAACAGLKARRTGFLEDYSGLEKIQGKEEWVYVDPRVHADTYSRFIVDPIQINLDESDTKRFTTEEIEELAQFFYATAVAKISESRQVVTEPGPGVARIRIALTGIRRSKALANILPVGRLLGSGMGGASMESEWLDSQNGDQVAAFVVASTGSRFEGGGMTKMSHAKRAIREWVDRISERIQEIRAIKRAEG